MIVIRTITVIFVGGGGYFNQFIFLIFCSSYLVSLFAISSLFSIQLRPLVRGLGISSKRKEIES
jgi:hypothetical protein